MPRAGITSSTAWSPPANMVTPVLTNRRTMNFGPLATLFAGSVRDDFALPEYGI
jgi:hypothetical protein